MLGVLGGFAASRIKKLRALMLVAEIVLLLRHKGVT